MVMKAYPKFALIRTLTKGTAFGERALLDKDKRTATIVCAEDT